MSNFENIIAVILLVVLAIAVAVIVGNLFYGIAQVNNFEECFISEAGYVGDQTIRAENEVTTIPAHYYVKIENKWGWIRNIWVEEEVFAKVKIGDIWTGEVESNEKKTVEVGS